MNLERLIHALVSINNNYGRGEIESVSLPVVCHVGFRARAVTPSSVSYYVRVRTRDDLDTSKPISGTVNRRIPTTPRTGFHEPRKFTIKGNTVRYLGHRRTI